MTCYCWKDDCELNPEMRVIRDHMREVVKQAHLIDEKQAVSQNILEDVHALLDDLYRGKCAETGKRVVC